jgi:hypothetical protein
MKYCLFILLLPAFFSSKAQRIVTYKFVVEAKVITDSATGFYNGAAYEFNYNRIYERDSVFEEKGLFSKDPDNTSVFKIKNGCWYIRIGNKWQLFYSTKEAVNPTVKIAGKWNRLRLIDTRRLKQFQCLIYKAEPIGAQTGGEIKYWFNPQKGIIKIETSEVALVREDIASEAPN